MRALLCLTSHVQSTLTARTSLQSCIRDACVQGPHTALIADPRMLRQSLINNQSIVVLHAFATHQGTDASYVALRDLPALVTGPLQVRLSATKPHRAISSSAAESSMPTMLDLCDKDKSLVKLFLAASSHQWHLLPGRCLLSARVSDAWQLLRSAVTGDAWFAELGRACYGHGCSVAHIRGCVRHVVV